MKKPKHSLTTLKPGPAAPNPYPAEEGNADYCGYGNHFWRIALVDGETEPVCRRCGHVKRRKKAA